MGDMNVGYFSWHLFIKRENEADIICFHAYYVLEMEVVFNICILCLED